MSDVSLEDLPAEVKERAKEIKESNEDLTESEAIAIARDQLDMTQDNDDCPEGQVKVSNMCVDISSVDAPPTVMSQPRVMSTASPLDTQPIERVELEGDTVAYRNIKLLDEGVWTDESSRTPTLYDETTFDNLALDYAEEIGGPPVNVAHDLDDQGEPNEASIGGHIDPESVDTDGKALFGDIVLDLSDPAGAFLDENLQSALESSGEVGFSPSVELMPTELEQADHPQAEQHVIEAKLTGTALVRDPASKSVDFRHETRNRQIAMTLEGQTAKRLGTQTDSMADIEAMRARLEQAGFELEEVSDDDVKELAEDLTSTLEGVEAEEDDDEAEEGDDDEETEEEAEEEEDRDMENIPDEFMAEHQEMKDRLQSLEETVTELRDAMVGEEDAVMSEDLEGELEAATEELAEASDVAEIEKTLSELIPDGYDTEEVSRALEAAGEEPEKPRTMSEGNAESGDKKPTGRIVSVHDPEPY